MPSRSARPSRTESIETDERREGLVSYIDPVDAEGRNEVAEAIAFEGRRALFPKGGGTDCAPCGA